MTASRMAGRYNPDDPALRYGVPVRHAALTSAAAGIRIRRGQIPVEQILLLAAVILFPLGLAFIMMGWWGAAHTGRLYAQIDYLISGGLFGLGISVAGGFMYFGYWLSRHMSESKRQNGLTLQSLQRLEELLEEAVATGPYGAAGSGRGRAPGGARRPTRAGATPTEVEKDPTREVPLVPAGADEGAAGADEGAAGADEGGAVLFATPRGSLLHRPDCPVVARRSDLRALPAGTRGFGYCTMCDAAGMVR